MPQPPTAPTRPADRPLCQPGVPANGHQRTGLPRYQASNSRQRLSPRQAPSAPPPLTSVGQATLDLPRRLAAVLTMETVASQIATGHGSPNLRNAVLSVNLLLT